MASIFIPLAGYAWVPTTWVPATSAYLESRNADSQAPPRPPESESAC